MNFAVVHGLRRFALALGVAASAAILGAAGAEAGEVRYSGDGHAQNPSWSLDGRHLAFEVNRYDGGTIQMYIAPVRGSIARDAARVSLPGSGGAFAGSGGQVVVNPVWHPQGLAVFEGSNQGGTYRLYFVMPAGGAAQEMLPQRRAPGNLSFPSISPDGDRLIFVSSATGNGDIYNWSRSSDQMVQLTDTQASEMSPLYSPDGQKVLFTRKRGHDEDVFEMPIGGGSDTRVVGGNGDQTRPVYADGGRVVYFTSERGDSHWDIASVDASGGDKRVLARDVRLPERARPALSPDGKWVAYASVEPARDHIIHLVSLDGSRTIEIATEYRGCGEPALTQQDGRVLLAYTALPQSGADWRRLYVMDITDRL